MNLIQLLKLLEEYSHDVGWYTHRLDAILGTDATRESQARIELLDRQKKLDETKKQIANMLGN